MTAPDDVTGEQADAWDRQEAADHHQQHAQDDDRAGRGAADMCYYHMVPEPTIVGAPVCGECLHQFQSDQDLIEQDNRVRREFGQIDNFTTSADQVFCCPFCAHDL